MNYYIKPANILVVKKEYEIFNDLNILFWLAEENIDFHLLNLIDLFLQKEEQEYSLPYSSIFTGLRPAFYLYLKKNNLEIEAEENLEKHFKNFLLARMPIINKFVITEAPGANEEHYFDSTVMVGYLSDYLSNKIV